MSRPLAVDAFCGAGGMTDGMLAAGFRVLGIDTVRRPEYRGDLCQKDIQTVHLDGALDDVAWLHASPPCQRFSLARAGRVADPPTDADLDLLREALRLRDEVRPRFWSIENVRGSLKWFRPILGEPRLRHGPFYFWGNFPAFLSEKAGLTKGINGSSSRAAQRDGKQSHRHRDPWLRSRLPIELTRPMAQAVFGNLEKTGDLRNEDCDECIIGTCEAPSHQEVADRAD